LAYDFFCSKDFGALPALFGYVIAERAAAKNRLDGADNGVAYRCNRALKKIAKAQASNALPKRAVSLSNSCKNFWINWISHHRLL
jgi:hypothetical protein